MLKRLSNGVRSIGGKFRPLEECSVVVVGLDNSGKSTIVNQLTSSDTGKGKGGRRGSAGSDAPDLDVAPTVGYRQEKFAKHKLGFNVLDMSGQGKYRDLWERQFDDAQAIIFVVDASDRIRLCVARDELEMALESDGLKGKVVPILVLANKMDVSGSMTPMECMNMLDLQSINNKPWHITATNAKTGHGVEAGIAWLAEHMAPPQSKERFPGQSLHK